MDAVRIWIVPCIHAITTLKGVFHLEVKIKIIVKVIEFFKKISLFFIVRTTVSLLLVIFFFTKSLCIIRMTNFHSRMVFFPPDDLNDTRETIGQSTSPGGSKWVCKGVGEEVKRETGLLGPVGVASNVVFVLLMHTGLRGFRTNI